MAQQKPAERDVNKARPKDMKPLHGYVLLGIPPKQDGVTTGGIVIPDTASQGDLRIGVVEDVGPRVPVIEQGPDRELRRGQSVLFDPKAKETVGLGDDRVLVPFQAVFATFGDAELLTDSPVSDFFAVPSWPDFIGTDYAAWEQFQNLTLFSAKVACLESFEELKGLARLTHECCVATLRGTPDLDLSSIRYVTQNDDLITAVDDDVWHGVYTVNSKRSFIELQKARTDVAGVHKTGPKLLAALARVLVSPEFQKLGGKDYSRVTCVVFRFHQRIKIMGRGAQRREATNSELMQQFLLFGQKVGKPATLDALALKPSDIGRIDMKVSFEKEVDSHVYRVFVNIEAPANEEHTIIDIEWEIQDHSPGIIPQRRYGPLLTTFFRDIVLRSFYKRWFQENDDVVCVTEKR